MDVLLLVRNDSVLMGFGYGCTNLVAKDANVRNIWWLAGDKFGRSLGIQKDRSQTEIGSNMKDNMSPHGWMGMDEKGSANKLNFLNKGSCKTILGVLINNWIGKGNPNGYTTIFKGVGTKFHDIIHAKIFLHIGDEEEGWALSVAATWRSFVGSCHM